MAANQTIIKAAGQRYSSVPTDYSGYLQGLTSVTNAIIEKTKATQKDQASIDKLMVDFNSKIKPYELLVKNKIGNADSPEEAMAMSKHFSEQKLRYETYMTKIHEMLSDGKQLTNSIDPQTELWLRSFGGGDFNKEYSITTPAVGEEGDEDYVPEKKHTFNMDFRLDENLNVEVIGPDGEYINMDELENKLNLPGSNDGASVSTLITKFATLPGVRYKDDGFTAPSERNFLAQKANTLREIKNLLKNGDGDISGNNVTEAFMFDEIAQIMENDQTVETSFLKWYLSDTEGELFPTGFADQYNEYSVDISGEIEEKQLAIIAQDLLKNDPNIKADLERYIDYLLELNR